jgi:DNA-binding IclR family transcriptional regulator
VPTRVGDHFALHATGVGLVLLRHAPAEIQEQVLSRPLRTWTEHTISDPQTTSVQCSPTYAAPAWR